MGYIPQDTVDAMRGAFNLGLFLRLESTPPVYLWWGCSNLTIFDSAEDRQAALLAVSDAGAAIINGKTYLGAGLITEIPEAVEIMLNGSSDRIDFTMSGCDPTLVANLDEEAPEILGNEVVFGFCPLDARWQPVGQIHTIWNGQAEAWGYNIVMPQKEGGTATSAITLICTSGSASRSSSSQLTWTNGAQKAISATDRFCERTPNYYQNRILRWPR